MQNFSTSWAWQDGEAAIVGLDGLCSLHRRQTGEPLVEKALLHRVAESAPIAEDVQPAGQAVERLVDLPGLFHREEPPDKAGGLAGLARFRVGIAAVDRAQRVGTQVPDGSSVGGDGIAGTGQLGHQRRQVGKGPPGAGQHDDPAPDGIGNGLPGGGSNGILTAQQRAVQIQGGNTNLRHRISF